MAHVLDDGFNTILHRFFIGDIHLDDMNAIGFQWLHEFCPSSRSKHTIPLLCQGFRCIESDAAAGTRNQNYLLVFHIEPVFFLACYLRSTIFIAVPPSSLMT